MTSLSISSTNEYFNFHDVFPILKYNCFLLNYCNTTKFYFCVCAYLSQRVVYVYMTWFVFYHFKFSMGKTSFFISCRWCTGDVLTQHLVILENLYFKKFCRTVLLKVFFFLLQHLEYVTQLSSAGFLFKNSLIILQEHAYRWFISFVFLHSRFFSVTFKTLLIL